MRTSVPKSATRFQWPRCLRLSLLGFMVLGVSGCLDLSPALTPTATSPPTTPTSTHGLPTLPPTATFTPAPSYTPTADLLGGLAELLFLDPFETDQGWESGAVKTGVVSILNGQLTFSLREKGAYLYAFAPYEVPPDFYAEVEVAPQLCGPEDEFGLMFRGRTFAEHYRFTLLCSGEARVSRILEGTEAALIPVSSTFAVFPGIPSRNKLGVQAISSSFRFFINDIEVFGARDGALPTGRIGLIVRSRQDSQTTITFDNVLIRGLLPTPTPPPPSATP